MGALKIDCYCNEKQMSTIVKLIQTHLSDTDDDEVADFDDVIDGVRVCVEFNTYMDSVSVKASEVLDSDWDVLYEDTAVLTSRLKRVVDNHNKNNNEAVRRARQIGKDEWAAFN